MKDINKMLLAVISAMFLIILSFSGIIWNYQNDKIETNKNDIITFGDRLDKIDSTILVGQLLDSVGTANIMNKLEVIEDNIK